MSLEKLKSMPILEDKSIKELDLEIRESIMGLSRDIQFTLFQEHVSTAKYWELMTTLTAAQEKINFIIHMFSKLKLLEAIKKSINQDIDVPENLEIKDCPQSPKITDHLAKLVNHIFRRLNGVIPSFAFCIPDNYTLDSLRREYAYALMRNEIVAYEIADSAINKIVDDKLTFIPSPGQFVEYCKSQK